MPEIAFGPVSRTDPAVSQNPLLRRQLAQLVIAAVPAFYSLIPLDQQELQDAIGEQIGSPGTELEQASLAIDGETAAALVTWLPLERLDAARRAGSIAIMRHLDRSVMPEFLKAIGEYSKVVEPLTGDGLYLSRVAVAPPFRGQGLGRRAVQQVIDAAGGGDVSLHVAADNGGAIALYRSMGFEFLGDGSFESRAMRRIGQARA